MNIQAVRFHVSEQTCEENVNNNNERHQYQSVNYSYAKNPLTELDEMIEDIDNGREWE